MEIEEKKIKELKKIIEDIRNDEKAMKLIRKLLQAKKRVENGDYITEEEFFKNKNPKGEKHN